MQFLYPKILVLVALNLILAIVFSLLTIAVFKPHYPKVDFLISDMTHSYTFVDDVYFLNIPSLKTRLEKLVSTIYTTTKQPICLSAHFTNFDEDGQVNLSVCSAETKLSELIHKVGVGGAVDVILGDRHMGTIEWVSQSPKNYGMFFGIFALYLLVFSFASVITFWLFNAHRRQRNGVDEESKTTVVDYQRSLYRIMGSNRRVMGLADNWVFCEREAHPNLVLYTLEGSRVRLRASLSDIAKIFPHARYIHRGALLNPLLGAHEIKDLKLILRIKNHDKQYEIDPTYLEDLEL